MSSVPAAIDQLTINSSIDSSSINSISSNLQPSLNQQQSSTQDQERSHYHSNIKDHHHHDLPIRLILIDEEIEDELHFGLKELCSNSIRNNLNFFDLNSTKLENLNESINQLRIKNDLRNPNKNKFSKIKLNNPQYSPSNHSPNSKLNLEFWWFIQFQKDPLVSDHQFSMTTSHSNFFHLSNSSPNYLIDTIKDLNQPLAKNGNERFCIKISYKRKSEAFRALGHLLGLTRHFLTHLINKSSPSPNFELNDFNLNENLALTSEICIEIVKLINNKVEICKFETLGIMIDCSRNGVLKLTSLKDLIRLISLMGLNILQLYTEDTYEISNEPFFGYFRGPYNQKELKDVDDYADSFGIEVVACIQTLGHLGQMLQWPRFGGMRDTHEVLLVGSQEVYDFIEKMIISITKPLRSKKIHIGMDEAHGVSEGRYRQLFGIKDSCQVFTDHLKRVNEICSKLGLKPMIWSDMLFCLAAKNNSLGGYYDSSNPATPELVESIPPEIELVYWDYYHTTPGPYINKINQHRDLNFKSPTMASGIWTWSRFWTALPFTIETIRASMKAIKNPKLGIKHALTTIWGDEGNECDIWSALPGILYYAEHAYSNKDEVDVPLLKRKFDGICGGSFDDFVFASKLDDLQPETQLIDDKARFTPNLSKWLIWEEPFYSILSPQYAGHDLETHYHQLSTYLDLATSHEPMIIHPNFPPQSLIDLPFNERLMLPNLLAKVLTLKCHLRDRLVHAYRQKDLEELYALAGADETSRMSRLRNLVEKVWKHHRAMWMSIYKPFGWEVLDLRYGGLRARLNTMHERLLAFLDPNDFSVTEIEELEVDAELVYPTSGAVMMLDYHRVSRPQYC